MANFEEELASLRGELLGQKVVEEFFKLKKEILADARLMGIEKQMQHHQKLMTKWVSNQEIYQFHKGEYLRFEKAFEDDPLVSNYRLLKTEIEELLKAMKSILE